MPQPYPTKITLHELLHFILIHGKPITYEELGEKYKIGYNLAKRRILMARKPGHIRYVGKIGGRKLFELSHWGTKRLIWYERNKCSNICCRLCNDPSWAKFNLLKKSLTNSF